MIILQISPEFTPGTGVGGVAYALEEQWLARGHDVRRFGLKEAGCEALAGSAPGLEGRLRHAARVVWFSTVGTFRARRAIRELPPGSVTICHNDALAGDIYVNHGILQTAMRARGKYLWRMIRNPLHLFTAARDHRRYSRTTHQLVVNLTHADDAALRREYPRITIRTAVIGNGVDTSRFRPPTPEERTAARAQIHVGDEALVTVFIGNEYGRKGLIPLVDAIAQEGHPHHLVVVGGTDDMVVELRAYSQRQGIKDRVHAVGRADPLPYLWAADLLAQPSSYESYGLVVTEALAAGVPVLSTHVGVALDVIQDGLNGFLTDGSSSDIAKVLSRFAASSHDTLRVNARQSALSHDWNRVADLYLDLFGDLAGEVV